MKFPDFVRGPLVIEHVRLNNGPCKNVYVVGESHELDATCDFDKPSTHFIDVVKHYGERHPHKRIAIVYEECFDGMITKTLHNVTAIDQHRSHSMLDKLTSYLYNDKLPDNVKVVFGDARFMEPFDKITALYEHETVLFNRYRSQPRKIWQDFKKDFMKECKKTEKMVIAKMKTRRSCRSFIRSLVLLQNNPIKEMLSTMPLEEKQLVEEYIVDHLKHLLDTNMMYTPMMQVLAARRNTLSPNLEFEKRDITGLNSFCVLLFSFLQDVYMLCVFLTQHHTYDEFIFIVGAIHAQNMSRFIHKLGNVKTSKVYRSNSHGCISMADDT